MTIHRILQVTPERVALLGDELIAAAPPAREDPAADPSLDEAFWLLERARSGTGAEDAAMRSPGAARAAGSPERAPLHRHLVAAGSELESCFLPEKIFQALAADVHQATRLGAELELGLDLDPAFERFPWEALRLPGLAGGKGSNGRGEPLALHPNVRLFRRTRLEGSAPEISIPPPLRVLVVVGSPESQNRPGTLLDYESELEKILASMDEARRQGRAYVRILHRGTVAEIRRALDVERFHVLYVTCHAEPGVLLLEDEEGEEDRVDTDRLWREALPAGRRPPLVVLAGCATGRPGAVDAAGRGEGTDGGRPGARHLPGLARGLLAKGVPAVLATQAPVSDLYATLLGQELFRYLAVAERPDPLAGLTRARRMVETLRRDEEEYRHLAEWATPTLYRNGPGFDLYDPKAPAETITEPPPPRLAAGVVVQAVGEFVGRRREERLLLSSLRADEHAGVLVHGLGGVGKSTLAAQVLGRLLDEGWLLASVHGEVAPEDLLDEVGYQLWEHFVAEGVSEDDPRRRVVNEVRRKDLPWEDRFKLLDGRILGRTSLLLLVDNFEDNLVERDGEVGWEVAEPALAEILTEWLRRPGKSRLLVTSRHPFELPRKTHRRLERLHLGPLSWPETKKLMYRLPALDALPEAQKNRAYRDVGGHPRTLEYLDALLRGDEELTFTAVVERLEAALEERGIERPDEWMDGVAGDLDQALAETVTLAADDVLLPQLLEQVDKVPMARQLLIGASVYRLPVDETGLMFQVGELEEEESEDEEDQDRDESPGAAGVPG